MHLIPQSSRIAYEIAPSSRFCKGDACQIATPVKCIHIYVCHTCGDGDGPKATATVERIRTNALDNVRYGDTRQPTATRERKRTDRGDTAVGGNKAALASQNQRLVFDMNETISRAAINRISAFHIDRSKRFAIKERGRGNARHTIRNHYTRYTTTAERILTDACHTARKCHARYAATTDERKRTDIFYAIGNH